MLKPPLKGELLLDKPLRKVAEIAAELKAAKMEADAAYQTWSEQSSRVSSLQSELEEAVGA